MFKNILSHQNTNMHCSLCEGDEYKEYRYSSVVNGLLCWLCRLELSQDHPYPYRERNYFQRAADKTCVDEITLRKRYLMEVLEYRAHESGVNTKECWLQLKALLWFQKLTSVSSNESEIDAAFQRLLKLLERNSVGVDLP